MGTGGAAAANGFGTPKGDGADAADAENGIGKPKGDAGDAAGAAMPNDVKPAAGCPKSARKALVAPSADAAAGAAPNSGGLAPGVLPPCTRAGAPNGLAGAGTYPPKKRGFGIEPGGGAGAPWNTNDCAGCAGES